MTTPRTVPTVLVWVAETDNPDAPFAINDLADMQDNWDDLQRDGLAQGTFDEYLSTWTEIEIPSAVWFYGDSDRYVADQLQTA